MVLQCWVFECLCAVPFEPDFLDNFDGCVDGRPSRVDELHVRNHTLVVHEGEVEQAEARRSGLDPIFLFLLLCTKKVKILSFFKIP